MASEPENALRNVENVPPERLRALIERVRREGAVRLRASGLGKLDRSAEGALLEALSRAGLEHTGQVIRVRLSEQIERLVAAAGRGGASERELFASIKGARSSAEVRLALQGLLEARSFTRFFDGVETRIGRASEQLLSGAEIDRLAVLLRELASLASTLRRHPTASERVTLARSALAPYLERLADFAGPRTEERSSERVLPEPASGSGELELCALRAALLVGRDELGLVRVPALIAVLEAHHAREALLRALLDLASAGFLELRPDAALDRLSDLDRARAPRALDGTPLVYARLLEAAGESPC